MSQVIPTMSCMGIVIDLAEWRGGREATGSAGAGSVAPEAMERLEAAVERLRGAVEGAAAPSGRIDAETETEVLAIIGELTTGDVAHAALRAERLTDRLRARAGGEEMRPRGLRDR